MYHSHYLYEVWHLRMHIFEAFLQLLNTCMFYLFIFRDHWLQIWLWAYWSWRRNILCQSTFQFSWLHLESQFALLSQEKMLWVFFSNSWYDVYILQPTVPNLYLCSCILLIFFYLNHNLLPRISISQLKYIWSAEYVTIFSYPVRVHCKYWIYLGYVVPAVC